MNVAEVIVSNIKNRNKYTNPISHAIEHDYNPPGIYQKRYKYLLKDTCKQQTNTAFDSEQIKLENLKFVGKYLINNVDHDAFLIPFKGK